MKVAIITASGRGLGKAIAYKLHNEGYRLSLMSPSGSSDQLAQELDGIGMSGSVTKPDNLNQLVQNTIKHFGRIDALVNNTGHPAKGDLLSITDEDWHEGMDLILLNVIRLCRLVVPYMLQQGNGSIVNISTFAAFEPDLSFPVSSAMRAGLAAFTKLFSDQYGDKNIRMNNVLPGFIDTYEVSEEIRKKIPMKRPATTEEVANAVNFLLSDDSSYITGQNLRVDGGITRSV